MAGIKMVRINTRISKKMNEWLDKQSNESGVPKSTLVYLALESYVQQTDALVAMGQLLQKLESLEKKLEKKISQSGEGGKATYKQDRKA